MYAPFIHCLHISGDEGREGASYTGGTMDDSPNYVVNFRWITLDELYGKPYIIYISNIIKFEDIKEELEV